jgi:uncharacterized protein
MSSSMLAAGPRRSKLFLASLAFSVVGGVAAVLLLWSAWRTRAATTENKALFVEEQVHFDAAKNKLAGTLVRPTTPGPHPAVVLVTDAGASDRTNGGTLPPLARHLAAQGMVCLSWDRPGVGGSSGDHEVQSLADRAGEALAALKVLQDRPEVDRRKVGIIGFGQGGMVAPLAASQTMDVALIVTISACQIIDGDKELYRVDSELRADGFHPTLAAEAMEVVRLKVELLRTNGSFEEYEATQKGLIGRPWFEYMQYYDRQRFEAARLLDKYDPAPVWEQVHCPVLAIYGAKDTVVPVDASLQVIRSGLTTAGNRELTVKTFQRADHRLAVSDTGGRKEAADRAKRRPAGEAPEFAPGYFDTVSGWLTARWRG